jgi:glyoxylase-like metal-dependent hydrolase (beta-lactamase superfamily II)
MSSHIRRIVRGAAISLTTLVVFLVAFTVWLLHGAVRSLPRSSYDAPKASYQTWEDVFSRAPKLELHSLDTGEVHVARIKMLQPRDAARYPGEVDPLHVFAHLIRHPTRGDFLVDSGLDATFAHARYGNIRTPAAIVLSLVLDAPYSQNPGQDIGAQLARIQGAKPVDVKAVFFTHLHMDHTAGLSVLRPNVELVVGRHEADDFAQRFGYGHVRPSAHLVELDFRNAEKMPFLGPSIDVFGDGSCWAVSTPGHSLGHVSFVVNATEGPVLLTGDASHFRWAFEHDAPPSSPSAAEETTARESLARLRAFAAAFPRVVVFTGHEAPR